MMTQVLDMLRDSLQYWHQVVILFIAGSFLKFGIRFWFDYQIAKLKAPSTYEVEIGPDRKVLKIHTHQKIEMQRIQSIANGEDERILLPIAVNQEDKKAA